MVKIENIHKFTIKVPYYKIAILLQKLFNSEVMLLEAWLRIQRPLCKTFFATAVLLTSAKPA